MDNTPSEHDSDFYYDLQARGLVFNCTDAGQFRSILERRSLTLYCGFDPSADSLHIGNLVPLLALRRFQEASHTPIALAGGATGLIGDPSGKSAERNLLNKETLDYNLSQITPQLEKFIDFSPGAYQAKLVNNAEWISQLSFLDFLRDIGKNFSVNRMIEKESVRARLEDRETGISYTEFSYMLIQAYDFYHLAKVYECELQIGGSDQWGNITAGIDLIRRMLHQPAFGLTFPLITTADGKKFGKTEQGSVWLSASRTSPYRFYQYWLNTDDRDVIGFLKLFTFLLRTEIDEEIAKKVQTAPEKREAQRILAYEVTKLVHGQTETDSAVLASQALFGGTLEGLSAKQLQDMSEDMPSTAIGPDRLSAGVTLIDLLAETALSPSKAQARKDIEAGGVYLNNVRETNLHRMVNSEALLFGKYLLLRRGKKNYHMVKAAD